MRNRRVTSHFRVPHLVIVVTQSHCSLGPGVVGIGVITPGWTGTSWPFDAAGDNQNYNLTDYPSICLSMHTHELATRISRRTNGFVLTHIMFTCMPTKWCQKHSCSTNWYPTSSAL